MAGEMIQIPINIPATATRGEFCDAIYVTQAAFAAMTPAQIEAAKQARYTAWKQHIDAQNVINRDPVVIARRESEAVAHTAEMVAHVVRQPAFDATLTSIIAAVRAGAVTPADVRARMLVMPTPIVTSTNTTPTMPGGMGGV